MRRSAIVFPLVCLLGLGAAVACAQSADPNDSAAPQDKVRGGAVRQRAPGNVINQARERHRGFINRRVNGPRSGQPVESATGTAGTAANNAATGLNSLLGGLGGSGLLGTLTSLTGGQLSMDQMNQINSLLSGTTGTGSSTTGGTSGGSASSGSNPNIPSNIPPDVIQTLVDAGFDLNELIPPSGTSKVVAGTTAVAADKTESRSQTNNTTTTPFHARWANAMLQTTFSALVLGFSSPDFVKLIEDALRPILLPGSIESDDSDNTTGGNNNNNSGGNSGSIVAIEAAHRPFC
ncbi:MAG TPA: hypothetical protein PKC49_00745 [Phycisphaerae bacterium]|nr:hypothetical protein [Phycisphaerae bacterium]